MKTYIKNISLLLALLTLFSCTSMLNIFAETYLVENDFTFTRGTDNHITVCGYVGKESNIVIPSKFIGYSPLSIAEYAFLDRTNLKSISIPATIKNIGAGAFYGCTSLDNITIPVNATNLGNYLFYGCTSLKNVSLNTVTSNIPIFCFSRCRSLESISLPETTKTIGDYAFSYCDSLERVYIPRFVTSISKTAFAESPHVAIYGYLNTYAHQYAQENGIAFCALDQDTPSHYVTYYNYDGSVFWRTSVEEGKNALMPSEPPQKPSTDTHYYTFAYWNGNISNITKNEDIYPVFTEHEIPDENYYYVVFLNGDGSFMKAETVLSGGSATPPADIPTKLDTNGKSYTFREWNGDYSYVTSDRVITPVFDEHTKTYTVTFLNHDGTLIDEFTVNHGEPSPTPDEIPKYSTEDECSYTFKGWDAQFDNIAGDLTVTATYSKNIDTVNTGKLSVEVSGGAGFTISVNGGAARPQGTSYYNTKMPMNTSVTLVANAAEGMEFLGWVNANMVVLSTEETYTFITTGNDFAKAVYRTDLDGASLVIFKNDKAAGGNGAILDLQYYVAGEEIVIPANPAQAGYDFAGWDMTAEEIAAKVRAGENVTVLATWTVAEVFVNVTVNGGTFVASKVNADGKIYANYAVTATANAAEAGKKFAYWADAETGEVLSYNAEYKFYPGKDTEITAIYVATDATVDYKVLVGMSADPNAETTKIRYYVTYYVPEVELGYEFVSAGVIIVDEANYKEDMFYHGSGLSGMTDTAPGSIQVATGNQPGAAVTKSNCFSGNTYYAKTWVIYKDAQGVEHTEYSDLLVITKL